MQKVPHFYKEKYSGQIGYIYPYAIYCYLDFPHILVMYNENNYDFQSDIHYNKIFDFNYFFKQTVNFRIE